MIADGICSFLTSFSPVALEELDNLRLMNRSDTKYLMSSSLVPELLQRLSRTYRILEIDATRAMPYSTTYLDTSDFLFYNQHMTGREQRCKVRYRTYQATGETFLEIKKRNNKGRTIKKRIISLIPSDGIPDETAATFLSAHIDNGSSLVPVLTSYFHRITLAGDNPPERVTIDFDISYRNNEDTRSELPQIAVVELKRDKLAGYSPVGETLKKLGIRQTGFSKYCIGASLLYDLPRRNLIKPKLLLINKIENESARDLRA